MQIKDIQIDENHKETTLHGSYDFPMAVYVNQLDKNVLGFINWHWHEEIQFSMVTKGEVEFLVNQNAYTLKEGQGIFINSACLHMSKPVANSDSTYICINADPKMFTFFPGSAIEQKYVKPFLKSHTYSMIVMKCEMEWQNKVLNKINTIYDLYSQKAYGYELDICLELADMWRLLITNQNKTIREENINKYIDQQRIKTIMSYIHEHYMEKITLQEIAAVVHISKGECCRSFKRVVKCTVFEYILNYRINKSIELLRLTDMTVSQIADLTGFGSTSYYIESFKKKVSCTPKEYRKSIIGK
ncbi:AraC family transcriptional regulator [Anaerosalibacter massiliensis]|uniref:AraC family transcriptional regulator n=1 Tax=Anaerosalibacter massiliensis TaxID=1347392 RepID=A0A9X2MGD9_9FIRM|nr:AraC family transcriptional regulator [Anaerosalibacter massiliensis]MCR2043043.1 AraC family transcriptional regulator [Anaerosalibacter massiliensis]